MKNGIPATLPCVIDSDIDNALLDLLPLSEQLLLEFYDKPSAEDKHVYMITYQMRHDLVKVIEEDCRELQIENEPRKVID